MAGAWARKKSQEVPIQGVIVNDETLESETDKTLSINAIKRIIHGNNLLFNGDFQVWQRGDSVIIKQGTYGYAADMFICENQRTDGNMAVYKIHKDSESETVRTYYELYGAGISALGKNGLRVNYFMPLDEAVKYEGKTVTLSYSVNRVISTKTYTFTITDENRANGYVNCFYLLMTAQQVLNWVKLEVGKIATLFVPRPYAEELMLCQRCLKIFHNISIRMLNRNSVYTYYMFVLENNMRTNGTVTVSNDSYIHGMSEEMIYGAPLSDFIAEYHYGRVIFRKKRNTSDNTTDSVLSIGILTISAEQF